jgi:hypothetical protein
MRNNKLFSQLRRGSLLFKARLLLRRTNQQMQQQQPLEDPRKTKSDIYIFILYLIFLYIIYIFNDVYTLIFLCTVIHHPQSKTFLKFLATQRG